MEERTLKFLFPKKHSIGLFVVVRRNLPAVLPLNAAIDVRQYSTADALCLIADSLYATVSPDFSSRVRTRLAIALFSYFLFVLFKKN